ncbi:hypothetical protein L6452_38923 [Arctium lappa]|uniref:Uncharacterized protein n=1 Tax=Arctium lappa TaxID=4217 RepID=A0ACB8XQV8_ARCLA|nr:hypothetical protein L6452_38923 [Arctium lappa]
MYKPSQSFFTTNTCPPNIIFHIKPISKILKISQENLTINIMATIVFIVFYSFGCACFLALASVALYCFIKKSKCTKTTEKDEMMHVDEHLKVKEDILEGPNGTKTVAITIDDDLHVHENKESSKNENHQTTMV